MFTANHRPGWIRRRSQQHASRPRGPVIRQIVELDLVAGLCGHGNPPGDRIDESDKHFITRIPGIAHQQFIPRVEQQTAQQQQTTTRAGGDDNPFGLHFHTNLIGIEAGNTLAQLWDTKRLGVFRLTCRQRLLSRRHYGARRGKIRFPNLEMHDVLAVGFQRFRPLHQLHHPERRDFCQTLGVHRPFNPVNIVQIQQQILQQIIWPLA